MAISPQEFALLAREEIKSGFLSQAQTDQMARKIAVLLGEAEAPFMGLNNPYNPEAEVQTIYRSIVDWGMQRGVNYDESAYPIFKPKSIQNGDYGPLRPVPPGFVRDLWQNWVDPAFPYVAPLQPALPVQTFVEPDRPLVAPSIVPTVFEPLPPAIFSSPLTWTPAPIQAIPAPAPIAPATITQPDEPGENIQIGNQMPSLEFSSPSMRTLASGPDPDLDTMFDSSNMEQVFDGTYAPDGTPNFKWTLKGLGKGLVNIGRAGLNIATGGLSEVAIQTGQQIFNPGADKVPLYGGSPTPTPVYPGTNLPTYTGFPAGQSTLTPEQAQLLNSLGGVIGTPGLGTVTNYLQNNGSPAVPGPVISNAGSAMGFPDIHTMPVIQNPVKVTMNKAPRGYVLMTRQWEPGKPAYTLAIEKSHARKLGWKAPAKAPISVGQWSAVKKAKTAKNKIQRVYDTAEALTSFKPKPRRRLTAKK